jgi:hypothetical protein
MTATTTTTTNNNIDWLSYSHGDDVDLTVTSRHQHRGTPKNRHSCAVVQAILASNPNVYDAVVQEGDVFIFIKDLMANKYWKLRCLMNAALRKLAKQRYDIDYNKGIVAEDTVITLRIDKLREILGPRLPQVTATKTNGTAAKAISSTARAIAARATAKKARSAKFKTSKQSVPTNPLRIQNSRPRRSRWDVSYFKIEKE